MSIESRLTPAVLKLEWSDHHFNKLVAIWHAFHESDFARVVAEDQPNGTGTKIKLVSEPLPLELAMCIGDVVHAMRCALDYAINDLFPKDSKLPFPFHENRVGIEKYFAVNGLEGCPTCHKGRTKGPYGKVEEALPGIGQVILDKVKPYKGGNDLIWILNKLDVRDKHRMILPVMGFSDITGIEGRYHNGMRKTVGAMKGGFGQIFAPIVLANGFKVDKFNKPTGDIFFNEPGIIEQKGVFPTLIAMREAVRETIDVLADFVGEETPVRGGH